MPVFRCSLNLATPEEIFERKQFKKQADAQMADHVSVPANYGCKVKTSGMYTICDAVITILSLLVYVADIITGSVHCS